MIVVKYLFGFEFLKTCIFGDLKFCIAEDVNISIFENAKLCIYTHRNVERCPTAGGGGEYDRYRHKL